MPTVHVFVVLFPLQPFLGSGGASNRVVGKIKLASDTLATIEGHWDMDTYIKEKNTGVRGSSSMT